MEIFTKNTFSKLSAYFCKMFRQIFAIIFIFSFVVQSFSKPFIVFDYFTNTSSYAKRCVNKAKPKMQCNGKCQMKKKIQEEEKKQQPNEENKSSYKTEVLCSESYFVEISHPEVLSFVSHPLFIGSSPIDVSSDFFHPPGSYA
jgi:hypothetical protein